MADSLAKGGRRVKVYVLNDNGKWDDRGTGHVRFEQPQRSKPLLLKVTAEDTGHIALCIQVKTNDEALYQMQGNTIISWTEHTIPCPSGVPTEMALSFAEADGCREVWDRICDAASLNKQVAAPIDSPGPARNSPARHPMLSTPADIIPAVDHDPSPNKLANAPDSPATALAVSNPQPPNLNTPATAVSLIDPADPAHSQRFFEDQLDNHNAWNTDVIDDVIFPDTSNVLYLGNSPAALVPGSSANEAALAASFVMPEPDRNGVEALSKMMSDQGIFQVPIVRERIIAEVSSGEYITKLCQVFRHCEQLADFDGLAMLYHVIRCLFIVGNNSVLEVLVSEKHVMDIVGCLEYDPEQLSKSTAVNKSSKPWTQNSTDSSQYQRQRANSASDTSSEKPPEEFSLKRTDGLNEAKKSPPRTASDSHKDSSPEAPKTQQLTRENSLKERHMTNTSVKSSAEKMDDSAVTHENLHVVSNSSSPHSRSDDVQPNCETRDLQASMAACDDSKPPQITLKNGSEETTSSGNLGGDEAERRFILRAHRDYLERKASYKAVVPITDPSVVAKIHQNYRVAYIKDAILSRIFDDGVNNALSSLILFNNVDIIMYFISGSSALRELFDRLKTTVQLRKKYLETSPVPTPQTLSDKSTKSKPSSHQAECKGVDKRRVSDNCNDVDMTMSIGEANLSLQTSERNSSEGIDVNASSGSTKVASQSRTMEESNYSRSGENSDTKRISDKVMTDGKVPTNASTGSPRSSERDEEAQRELASMLGFLNELCNVAKNQQQAVRDRFHALLRELGVLEVSVSMLSDRDLSLRLLACDILSAAVIQDQSDVRLHILESLSAVESSFPQSTTDKQSLLTGTKEKATKPKGALRSYLVPSKSALPMLRSSPTPYGVTGQGQLPRSIGTPDGLSDDNRASIGKRPSADSKETACRSKNLNTSHSKDMSDTEIRKNLAEEEQSCRKGQEGNGENESNNESFESQVHGLNSRDSVTGKEGTVGITATNSEASGSRVEPFGEVRPTTQKNAGPMLEAKVTSGFPLLSAVMDIICQDSDSGVILPVLDLLRTLLDTTNMRSLEGENFLDVFYGHFIGRLLDPIVNASRAIGNGPNGGAAKSWDDSLSHICDLFSFCVINHNFRSKHFVVGNDVAGKVLKLLQHDKAYIRLSALRFFRACVGLCDEVYERYLVKEQLFNPIMQLYTDNKNQDNLTSSAILEMVKFICTQSRVFLLKHVIENHSSTLEPSVKHCDAFAKAKEVYHNILGKQKSGGVDVGQGSGVHEEFSISQMESSELAAQFFQNTSASSKVGGNFRMNGSFFGQDIRIAPEQDGDDGFFSRSGEEDQVMQDLQPFMESESNRGLHGSWMESRKGEKSLSESILPRAVGGNRSSGDEEGLEEVVLATWGQKSALVPYGLDDESGEERSGRGGRMRLSLSKSEGGKGAAVGEEGESFCESSEECTMGKRERSGGKATTRSEGGGMESCTRSVDADAKRRRRDGSGEG